MISFGSSGGRKVLGCLVADYVQWTIENSNGSVMNGMQSGILEMIEFDHSGHDREPRCSIAPSVWIVPLSNLTVANYMKRMMGQHACEPWNRTQFQSQIDGHNNFGL